jgi:hypothetical protein
MLTIMGDLFEYLTNETDSTYDSVLRNWGSGIGAVLGIVVGFGIGGVGGGILFSIVGAILGLFVPGLIKVAALTGVYVLVWGIIIGGGIGILALIVGFWGAGR